MSVTLSSVRNTRRWTNSGHLLILIWSQWFYDSEHGHRESVPRSTESDVYKLTVSYCTWHASVCIQIAHGTRRSYEQKLMERFSQSDYKSLIFSTSEDLYNGNRFITIIYIKCVYFCLTELYMCEYVLVGIQAVS